MGATWKPTRRWAPKGGGTHPNLPKRASHDRVGGSKISCTFEFSGASNPRPIVFLSSLSLERVLSNVFLRACLKSRQMCTLEFSGCCVKPRQPPKPLQGFTRQSESPNVHISGPGTFSALEPHFWHTQHTSADTAHFWHTQHTLMAHTFSGLGHSRHSRHSTLQQTQQTRHTQQTDTADTHTTIWAPNWPSEWGLHPSGPQKKVAHTKLGPSRTGPHFFWEQAPTLLSHDPSEPPPFGEPHNSGPTTLLNPHFFWVGAPTLLGPTLLHPPTTTQHTHKKNLNN